MSEYCVTTDLQSEEWQLKNQARGHVFFADQCKENGTDAGPNPVEYLTGAVNSCIAMSAGMIIKSKKYPVSHFKVTTQAVTNKLVHGQSVVDRMTIDINFTSSMTPEEKQKFVDFILHVSTVYQTVSHCVKMTVKLNA
ncbi:OsmC family protein [uncultured Limosilactobacillus sp.]|uniref:OsmC family protein n=1 Tax=uncultured Limosilactobacillus sp. TaxID=2837629 RepID=UPI0025CE090D|nr:OsmC family protein [uncultured Limosilactobacillus sp.]